MQFKISFSEDKPFRISFGQDISFANYPEYTGKYELTPKTQPQKLSTQNTYLTKDILFGEIPYHEVSNNQNGVTAVIGGI